MEVIKILMIKDGNICDQLAYIVEQRSKHKNVTIAFNGQGQKVELPMVVSLLHKGMVRFTSKPCSRN